MPFKRRRPPRALRRYCPHWRGRNGPGLSGHRYQARPRCRPEDPARRVRPRPRAAGPFPARSEGPGIAQSIRILRPFMGWRSRATPHALVLEYVEGPTLQDRISQGPIPLDEALPIARQIAEALEAAHERGIIHRDLKPANVKVKADGTVKVLDFGLAKALDPAPGSAPAADAENSPTMTAAPATELGVIMGTAAYMSPEQARGKSVDKRSDIWAFGCLLFETLTGRRAFDRETVTDTLAAIIGGGAVMGDTACGGPAVRATTVAALSEKGSARPAPRHWGRSYRDRRSSDRETDRLDDNPSCGFTRCDEGARGKSGSIYRWHGTRRRSATRRLPGAWPAAHDDH